MVGILCQRTAFPVLQLLEFLTKDLKGDDGRRRLTIKNEGIFVDASVAISAGLRGESEVYGLISKSQAVDLAFMRDAIKVLKLDLVKVPSALNISDLWTKCVSQHTLAELTSLAGRSRNRPKFNEQN
jgi:hypothetical protein